MVGKFATLSLVKQNVSLKHFILLRIYPVVASSTRGLQAGFTKSVSTMGGRAMKEVRHSSRRTHCLSTTKPFTHLAVCRPVSLQCVGSDTGFDNVSNSLWDSRGLAAETRQLWKNPRQISEALKESMEQIKVMTRVANHMQTDLLHFPIKQLCCGEMRNIH